MFPKIGVPPKHPKMIIFSRKTHGCWVPPFLETPIFWPTSKSYLKKFHPSFLRVEVVCSTSECSQPWLMRKASWKKRTKRQKSQPSGSAKPRVHHAESLFVWWVHVLKLIAVRTWKNGGMVNEAFPKFWEPASWQVLCEFLGM